LYNLHQEVPAKSPSAEQTSRSRMNEYLRQYYRCVEQPVRFVTREPRQRKQGYFQFRDAICFGSYHGREASEVPAKVLHDSYHDAQLQDGRISLPFDPSEVVDNLRWERYVKDWRDGALMSAASRLYYLVRPTLSAGARSYLQKRYLKDWDEMAFPRWPVDRSVDELHETSLLLYLRSSGLKCLPFIWFWPAGAASCAIMTHDVETKLGRNFCPTLMDIDEAFGIKASFQIIPEQRYSVNREFLGSIRDRGFEVVIHDLNHDGHLYKNREQFLKRAARINAYCSEYGAEGFRAAVLYRKQLWYDALNVSYDMSVPNVAHLDPQRGGCCTVMPYFLGHILELPVTTTQDYTLFHILSDRSIDLWKQQIELIMEKHGLISFVVHPDYIMKTPEQKMYEALLGHLTRLRHEKDIWITTPGEVNRWWRQRAQMKLVESGNGWQIEGRGKERACIAFASEEDGRLNFTLVANSACSA
jgi:hypothetical protein